METVRLADQLRKSARGPCWHGPSVLETLDGVDARMASSKPAGFRHSIWELLLHCCAWQSAAHASLSGTQLGVDADEDFPLPPQNASEESWEAARAWFESGCDSLAAAAADLPDEKLSASVPGRTYNFYFLLHGVVQHNLYHAGQMMQLRRFLEKDRT